MKNLTLAQSLLFWLSVTPYTLIIYLIVYIVTPNMFLNVITLPWFKNVLYFSVGINAVLMLIMFITTRKQVYN